MLYICLLITQKWQFSQIEAMKILHISDTHGCHHRLRDLPEADVAVHSGDFCMVGTTTEAIDFLNWFCDLPYQHKIFICGNHDDCLYGANINGLDANVHYLCNSGIVIDGVNFYGVPMFMNDCITDRQSRNIANIPTGTDVLITHSPPYGILDYADNIHYGSEEISQRIAQVHPRLHLFGHIHVAYGIARINGINYSNAAIMDDSYSNLNAPCLIEL